jgi:flagellar motor switch protein FliM
MAVSQSGEQSEQPSALKIEEQQDALEPRIRALDFSQPTKFTTEIRRRIVAALEEFCAELAADLTNELKTEVELSVGDVAQHTWAGAKASLPADSIAIAVQEGDVPRHMLMSVELRFLLQALECLLGGNAAQAPSQRHLSDIDLVLGKDLLTRIVAELSRAWEDLGGPPLRRGELDMEGDAGVLIPVTEPTLLVAFAGSLGGAPSALSLLIPWAVIEPIAASIRSTGITAPAGGEAHEREGLRRGLAGAKVLLRAEVGSVQMPIERMLELNPGSLVRLTGRAEEGVVLFAEEVSLGRGRPGRSGTRRAIKLESTGEAAISAERYAKLGRAELERARAHADGAGEGPAGGEILRSIFVRVWAELGRTHLALGRALELMPGAVVELDQAAQSPVELFANGLCFANGSLVVTAEGEWGVQVAELI